MTKHRRPQPSIFNTFFDDIFTRDDFFENHQGSINSPSANIKETDEAFKIELAAPGMNKEDFEVNVEKEILTLSAEVKKDSAEENETYRRREFRFSSFKRNFRLPETIDTENITAEYKNGVLNVTLPKNEKALIAPVRQIKVG